MPCWQAASACSGSIATTANSRPWGADTPHDTAPALGPLPLDRPGRDRDAVPDCGQAIGRGERPPGPGLGAVAARAAPAVALVGAGMLPRRFRGLDADPEPRFALARVS